MARQLKRWESPRQEGRNRKGRGGSARQRQRRKQFQTLRQKLKQQSGDDASPPSRGQFPAIHHNPSNIREANRFPFFMPF